MLIQIQSKIYELAFIFMILKGLIYNLSISEAIVMLGLVGAMGYKGYVESKKVEKNLVLENTVLELSRKVDTLMMANNLRKMGQPSNSTFTGGDFGRTK